MLSPLPSAAVIVFVIVIVIVIVIITTVYRRQVQTNLSCYPPYAVVHPQHVFVVPRIVRSRLGRPRSAAAAAAAAAAAHRQCHQGEAQWYRTGDAHPALSSDKIPESTGGDGPVAVVLMWMMWREFRPPLPLQTLQRL